MPIPTLTVYTRVGCELCEEFLHELGEFNAERGVTVLVRDVDADPSTRERYGNQVPVLFLDGELLCFGRLDRTHLARRLAACV
jgi:glutaredoxin